jgi:hypothetical protein
VPQFTLRSTLQVCVTHVVVLAESHRGAWGNQGRRPAAPRVSPPIPSPRSRCPSSTSAWRLGNPAPRPPAPLPSCQHIFHAAATGWAGRAPRPHSHRDASSPPPRAPSIPLPSPLSPAPSLLFSQRANFTPKFLFCPFLGCFPVGRRGGAEKATGEGKH